MRYYTISIPRSNFELPRITLGIFHDGSPICEQPKHTPLSKLDGSQLPTRYMKFKEVESLTGKSYKTLWKM
ncbi:hypothetical protein BSPA111_21670 [Buttiauxella sp. A111]|nr:hypothetical protein BSPA111_21670 [Buttiauxella sp. A111]